MMKVAALVLESHLALFITATQLLFTEANGAALHILQPKQGEVRVHLLGHNAHIHTTAQHC